MTDKQRCRAFLPRTRPATPAPDQLIVRDSNLQILRCLICGDHRGFSRAIASDPEKMFILGEEMTADHQGCVPFRHDPARAARERRVTMRLRAEMRKLRAAQS